METNLTINEIRARIEVLEKLVSTPISNWMTYAMELANLKVMLDDKTRNERVEQ